LIAYHHGLQWEDGIVPYNLAKRLIAMAIVGTEKNVDEDDDDNDDEVLIYVKGSQKRKRLKDMFESGTKDHQDIRYRL